MKIADMTVQDLSERLLIAVINYDESADRLLNFPHIRKGSFAVLTQLCVGDKNLSGHYSTCLTVTNDMLNGWGISKNELFQMASENSVKQFPAVLQPITDFVKGSESVFLEEAFDISRIRVLSTKHILMVLQQCFIRECLSALQNHYNVKNITLCLPV